MTECEERKKTAREIARLLEDLINDEMPNILRDEVRRHDSPEVVNLVVDVAVTREPNPLCQVSLQYSAVRKVARSVRVVLNQTEIPLGAEEVPV
ncbi:MAG: hypothetical protein ABQ298_03595 [Puniceicoccaceae bacterium]